MRYTHEPDNARDERDGRERAATGRVGGAERADPGAVAQGPGRARAPDRGGDGRRHLPEPDHADRSRCTPAVPDRYGVAQARSGSDPAGVAWSSIVVLTGSIVSLWIGINFLTGLTGSTG